MKAAADSTLAARHTAERALRCWGAGAGLAYQATKDAIACPAEGATCLEWKHHR